VEVKDEAAFEAMADKVGIKVTKIGNVGGEKFTCNDVQTTVASLKEIYFTTFQKTIEQDI
jgi:phosphoribosylformylglycinamidine synthase